MNEEMKKDVVLLAEHIRRLALKYPKACISGFTYYDDTSAIVTYSDNKPKKDKEYELSDYMIEESGRIYSRD